MLLLGFWNGKTKETRGGGEDEQAMYGMRMSPLALRVPAHASNREKGSQSSHRVYDANRGYGTTQFALRGGLCVCRGLGGLGQI